MNIKEAKEYIEDTVKLYLKKDEYGDYRIPVVRQRPIFLLGAPGIGKTAIMEQVASKLGIALVSYSMTHHTRQSALGLPFIDKKEYGGKTVSVSEYTMSEIIASVYDTVKESGVSEGILFLDEINCVSETLYPSMLQFLQYKTFGRHKVPEGWVIVTAGNPPEFNKAVREFDVVTLDRLKVLNVEADYPAWKEYAEENALHGAILGFLDANREYFYKIENTTEGRNYVTARGWEDLSQILFLYEEDGIVPGIHLIGQYIHDEQVVREFTAYYELYNKYKETYRVQALLSGDITAEAIARAQNASVDEKLALEGLLVDAIKADLRRVNTDAEAIRSLTPALKKAKESDDPSASLKELKESLEDALKTRERSGALTVHDKKAFKSKIRLAEEFIDAIKDTDKKADDLSNAYSGKVSMLKEAASKAGQRLSNGFKFTKEAYGEESNEMLVMVTELTVDINSASFLAAFGSEDYEKYSGLLMVSDRESALRKDIENLL